MEEPALELLPAPPLFPTLGSQLEAAGVAVTHEESVQTFCRASVCHEQVALIVKRKTTAVEVGGTEETVEPVNHHDFAMVETSLKEPDFCTGLHEFVDRVFHDAGSDGDVALC